MDRADFRLLGLALAALAMAVATACSDPSDVPALDASVDMDGDVDPMADAATSGLRVRFFTSPRVPGDFEGEEEEGQDRVSGKITRADFDLRTLRVVGDVGMVEAPAIDLRFRDETEFFEMSFGRAQPGIYGRFAAEVTHIDIRGEVEFGDEEFEFRITDDPPQGLDIITVLAGVELGSGQLVTIDIAVDLDHLLSELDWSMAERDDGEIEIKSGDDLIGAVRHELSESFEQK